MANTSGILLNSSIDKTNVSSENEEMYYTPEPTEIAVVVTIFSLVLLVGVVGNILVILVIAFVKAMHTNVNRCLLSLAIADLIILVFLPIGPLAGEFTDDFSFLGKGLCMFLNFYDRGAVVCSVLLFVYMTVDRYLALCYPLVFKSYWLGRHTFTVLVVIWIIALATSGPYLDIGTYKAWYTADNTTHYSCYLAFEKPWQIWYETIVSILVFFVPIPFLTYFYTRMIINIRRTVPTHSRGDSRRHASSTGQGRKQVITMLLTVVVIFLICQLPFTFLSLLDFHFPHIFSFYITDFTGYLLTWTARILIYVNSASNPVIYFAMSSNFRQAFRKMFCNFKQARGPSAELSNTTGTTESMRF